MSNPRKWESDKEKELKKAMAAVSFLPSGSGDGYGYGGGAVVTIGDRSIQFGEGYEAGKLAEEVVRRWNAAPARTEAEQS